MTDSEVIALDSGCCGMAGLFGYEHYDLSRAIGETMIVVLAAGATPQLTLDPRESVQTMTAFIVSATLGDSAQGSAVFQSLFAVGLLLFLLTLAMNVGAQRIVRRFGERA